MATKTDMRELREGTKADLRELRDEIQKVEYRLTIKLGAMFVVGISVLAALIKLA